MSHMRRCACSFVKYVSLSCLCDEVQVSLSKKERKDERGGSLWVVLWKRTNDRCEGR